jgi:hypothetical protein
MVIHRSAGLGQAVSSALPRNQRRNSSLRTLLASAQRRPRADVDTRDFVNSVLSRHHLETADQE